MPDLTKETISNLALSPEENPCPVLRVDGDGVLLYANRASTNLLAQCNAASIAQRLCLHFL